MPKVQIEAELSEECLRRYEEEARRRGVTVESLVQCTVNALLRDMEHDEHAGCNCPGIPV